MPVIPPHERLKQEDCEFKASLDYIVRPCLKIPASKMESIVPTLPKVAKAERLRRSYCYT
jgi:hypothetical protein